MSLLSFGIAPQARAKNKSWYKIQQMADEAIIFIYSTIGEWGVSADDFVRELMAITAPTIHVHINSPGGSVFDGFAIYTAMKRHPSEIVVHIDALAASCASLVSMAGDKIIIAEHARVMIHDPWVFAIGNAKELREAADFLESLGKDCVKIYSRRSGLDESKIAEMMEAETWMSAEEALEMGFADEIEGVEDDEEREEAAPEARVYKNCPADIRSDDEKPKQDWAVMREQALRNIQIQRELD